MNVDLNFLQNAAPANPESPALAKPVTQPARELDKTRSFSSALRQANKGERQKQAREREASASGGAGAGKAGRALRAEERQAWRVSRQESRVRPSESEAADDTAQAQTMSSDDSIKGNDARQVGSSVDQATQSLVLAHVLQPVTEPSSAPLQPSETDVPDTVTLPAEREGSAFVMQTEPLPFNGGEVASVRPFFQTPHADETPAEAQEASEAPVAPKTIEADAESNKAAVPLEAQADQPVATSDQRLGRQEPVRAERPIEDKPKEPSLSKSISQPFEPKPADRAQASLVVPQEARGMKHEFEGGPLDVQPKQEKQPAAQEAKQEPVAEEAKEQTLPRHASVQAERQTSSESHGQGRQEQGEPKEKQVAAFAAPLTMQALEPSPVATAVAVDRGMSSNNQVMVERPQPVAQPAPVTPPPQLEQIVPAVRSVVVEVAQPDLGRVNVRVSLAQDLVHTHFSSDRADVGQLLVSGQDRLQSALQASGFDMGQFRVSVDRQQDQHGPQQWLAQTYDDRSQRQRGQSGQPHPQDEPSRRSGTPKGLSLFA